MIVILVGDLFNIIRKLFYIVFVQTAGNEESVTSSEFERFLAERAAAAENQPSTTTNSSTSKGKAEKDSLFAI